MHDKGLVNIVIPVYKEYITNEERISLLQCIKILSIHPITLVSQKSLNLDVYFNEYTDFKVEYFDSSFFQDIQSYNKLLLSFEFYNRFKCYSYILIYQLDAYIFNDKLEQWCKQGYDYIGAPWFVNFKPKNASYFLGNVGNGGFSLRRTKGFIRILSYKGPIYKPGKIKNEINFRGSKNIIKSWMYYLAQSLGYKNTISYLIKKNEINEDAFWSSTFCKSWIKLNIAPAEIALKFSFEKNPRYLFELNKKELPLGCHAWKKYEYQEFWKQYIN